LKKKKLKQLLYSPFVSGLSSLLAVELFDYRPVFVYEKFVGIEKTLYSFARVVLIKEDGEIDLMLFEKVFNAADRSVCRNSDDSRPDFLLTISLFKAGISACRGTPGARSSKARLFPLKAEREIFSLPDLLW